MVSRPSREMLDEVVIDIKMFNGSVDVLRYAQGELHNGENILRKRVPHPTQITGMPNMVGDKVIMDGWYSHTAIIFRNIAEGLQ
jgi:hypothetical protein